MKIRVVNVGRKSNRIITVKLVCEEKVLNIGTQIYYMYWCSVDSGGYEKK